jgi:hypothetical protein
MHVARELKMSLSELAQRMTPEELELWLAFFQIEQDELKKAK